MISATMIANARYSALMEDQAILFCFLVAEDMGIKPRRIQ